MIDRTHLSKRELDCLRMTAEGMNRKEIACAMGISLKTVEYFFHGSNLPGRGIYEKLHTNSVALLTQWALKHGVAQWKV